MTALLPTVCRSHCDECCKYGCTDRDARWCCGLRRARNEPYIRWGCGSLPHQWTLLWSSLGSGPPPVEWTMLGSSLGSVITPVEWTILGLPEIWITPSGMDNIGGFLRSGSPPVEWTILGLPGVWITLSGMDNIGATWGVVHPQWNGQCWGAP